MSRGKILFIAYTPYSLVGMFVTIMTTFSLRLHLALKRHDAWLEYKKDSTLGELGRSGYYFYLESSAAVFPTRRRLVELAQEEYRLASCLLSLRPARMQPVPRGRKAWALSFHRKKSTRFMRKRRRDAIRKLTSFVVNSNRFAALTRPSVVSHNNVEGKDTRPYRDLLPLKCHTFDSICFRRRKI